MFKRFRHWLTPFIGPDLGNETENSPAAQSLPFHTRQDYNRFSDLFPWTGYWKQEKLFALEGQKSDSIVAIGYCIELNPQTGATEDMANLIQEIYRDMPVGSGVQVHLYGSPDINQFIEEYRGIVNYGALLNDDQRRLIHRLTEARVKHYKKCKTTSTISSRPSVMRQYRALLSVSIPVKNTDQDTIDRILQLRAMQISKLKTYYQFKKVWQASDLIAWVRVMLSPGQDIVDPVNYDNGTELRYQILYRDTKVDVDDDGLGLHISSPDGKATCVRALSAINYPADFKLHQTVQLLGESIIGSKGYPCPFMITMGALIIDYDQHKNSTDFKAARAIQLSESPMARFLPEMGKRAQDWKIMQQSYSEGSGGIRLYHQVHLFPKPGQVSQAEEAARAIWRSLGFTLTSDYYMQTQALMSALPMSLTPALLFDMDRAQRMTTKTLTNAANLSPVLAEWSGLGPPVLTLRGRNGQLIGIDVFSNPSGNYNGCVVGTSGSGKSAALNEMAKRYLAYGAKVWIIDVGRSYEKLCRSLGGQFIEFTNESGLVLNPFTMVRDIEEDMEMLKPLLAQMISPSRPLNDYELSGLEFHIQQLWQEYGEFMTMDLLAERLMATLKPDENGNVDSRLSDLGVQLYPYTSQGSYGKYFSGPHTVNFHSNMVVLELDDLASKKDLQSVVMFILMYRITQDMYLTPRDHRKLVIMDEAWDLLAGGQSADFIEKGYRRARKYGGAFWTGTQGVGDYDISPAARAARENADWMFMLRQKQESIARLEEKLAFTPHMRDLVASLRTEQGLYSEIFVSCGQSGYGVGLLSMDPFSQLMGSAKAEDFTAVRLKESLGMNTIDAIDAVLKDRGIDDE